MPPMWRDRGDSGADGRDSQVRQSLLSSGLFFLGAGNARWRWRWRCSINGLRYEVFIFPLLSLLAILKSTLFFNTRF